MGTGNSNVGEIGHKDEDRVVRGDVESLAELRTAFGPESLVTANASGVVDEHSCDYQICITGANGDKPLAKISVGGLLDWM